MLVVEALFIIQVYLGKLLLLGMLAMSQYVYNVQWGIYNSGTRFNYPISFSQKVCCAIKTATDTTLRNNLLISESALVSPTLSYVDLPSTSPTFYSFVLVVGW